MVTYSRVRAHDPVDVIDDIGDDVRKRADGRDVIDDVIDAS